MVHLLAKHSLQRAPKRVVVAANLRLALRRPEHLTRLLDDTDAELLLWTGTGEPPVGQRHVDDALEAFPSERLAFDARIAPATAAAVADAKLSVWRSWRKAKNAIAPTKNDHKKKPKKKHHKKRDDARAAPRRTPERTCCAGFSALLPGTGTTSAG